MYTTDNDETTYKATVRHWQEKGEIMPHLRSDLLEEVLDAAADEPEEFREAVAKAIKARS